MSPNPLGASCALLLLCLPALCAAVGGESADDGARAYATHCGSCHLAEGHPRPAPPARAVARRYARSYPQRDAFVAAVTAWLAAPSTGRALMPRAIEHHGLMPALPLDEGSARAAAGYLYTLAADDKAGKGGHGPGSGHGGGMGGRHGEGHGAGGGHGGGCASAAGHDCQGPRRGAPDGPDAGADPRIDRAALERGAAAVAPLRERLLTTLTTALAAGAPAAVERCRLVAPDLPGTVAAVGTRLGRTSDRLRNPANVGPAWVEPLLAAYRDGAARRPRSVVLADGRVGYVEPITVMAPCLACHGAELAPGVAEVLHARYPDDRATGYAVGDLRGVFWAELPP